MTTTEILDTLEKEQLYQSIGEEVKMILTESDLVKFAKLFPDSDKSEQLMSDTVGMVEKTKIVPLTEEAVERAG